MSKTESPIRRLSPELLSQAVGQNIHQPFRGRVAGSGIQISSQPQRVGVPHSGCAAEPDISLVHENGLLRAIDVTCSCGQTLRLVCEYDGTS